MIHGNSKDNYTLLCIRQAILDDFWSQETSAVSVNLRRLRRDYFESVKALSIRRVVPIIINNEVRDKVGMGCELQTLYALWRQIKLQDQLQWDSMRRTPTWYNNEWEAGAGSSETGSIYS